MIEVSNSHPSYRVHLWALVGPQYTPGFLVIVDRWQRQVRFTFNPSSNTVRFSSIAKHCKYVKFILYLRYCRYISLAKWFDIEFVHSLFTFTRPGWASRMVSCAMVLTVFPSSSKVSSVPMAHPISSLSVSITKKRRDLMFPYLNIVFKSEYIY